MRILCRVSSLCCAAGSRFLRPLAKALPRRSAVCSRPAAFRDRKRNDHGRGGSLGRLRAVGPWSGARGSGRKRLRGGGLGLGAHGLVGAAQVVWGGAFGGIRTNGGGSSPTSTGHGSGPGTRPSGTWTNRRRLTPCGRPKAASRRPRVRGSIPPTWTVDGGEIMYRRGDVAAGRHHAPVAAADDHGDVAKLRPVALLDRRVEGVAVEMGDREIVQFGVAEDARPSRRPGRSRHRLAAGGRSRGTAFAREDHGASASRAKTAMPPGSSAQPHRRGTPIPRPP